MAEPFRSLPARRGLGRLVAGRSQAVRALEELLAQAECVRDVSDEQVRELAERNGVDLARSLHTARCALYRRFLEHCLADQALSEEEFADLTHLARVLELTDQDAAEIHDQVARAVYGQAIEQVLADHRLDPEEAEFLGRLGRELKLPEEHAAALYQEGAGRARQRFIGRNLVHDSVFLAGRDTVVELRGVSQTSLEHAIAAALVEGSRAVPDLRDFEVTRIHGELDSGRVASWQVAVRARFDSPK